MSLLPETGDSDSEPDFDWDEYLRETNSMAAPSTCFQQATVPPENKFEEGMKLEASDARFPNIVCAATVIAKFGPKIRLRMIGAGGNDDFWLLVDSRHIHHIGYTESQGGFLSPPFNCQRDGTRWSYFLKNTLSTATLAPVDCFVPEPPRPRTNLFHVGQKLEACDSRDTTFVCPATVVEIKGDRLRIEFDGWNTSDWIRYDSREIFPVGWWGKANIPINPPPKKQQRKTKSNAVASSAVNASSSHNYVNLFDSAKSLLTPTVPDTETSTKQKQEERSSSPLSSVSSVSTTAPDKPATVSSHHHTPSGLPKHKARKTITTAVVVPVRSETTTPPITLTTIEERNNLSTSEPKSDSTQPASGSKAMGNGASSSNSAAMKRKTASSTKSPNSQPSDWIIPDEDSSEIFTVYLNSSCAAGKWLDSNKLLSSGTRFGPGTVNHVMRSCLQLLIDCATDPGYVYHAIPSGDGHASLSADFLGSTRIRHLPVFRSALDGWKYLTGVLDKLQTCPHLLSKQLGDCLSCTSPPTLPPKKSKQLTVQTTSDVLPVDIPSRKRQGSGGSNSSTCTERETGPIVSTEDVQKWHVDEVSKFISSVTDSASGDLFRKQEIDGKALLLLTADMMIRYMNVRLGPALKIANAVEKLKTNIVKAPSSDH